MGKERIDPEGWARVLRPPGGGACFGEGVLSVLGLLPLLSGSWAESGVLVTEGQCL